MASIRASMGHNLRHLADFSGRDTPGQFWPWAIFLFLLSMAAGLLLFVPVLADMFVRIERYLREHPEGFPEQPGGAPATLPPELMPDMSAMLVPMAVVNLLFAMLLAAAVVRRLHDRDWSGWWALLPVPFMVYSQFQGSKAATMMMRGTSDPAVLMPAQLNGLFYWIAVIALVVILVQQGTSGTNRFGPEPSEAP